MMMKLKMGGTLAKAFAKKHYAGAMDAMKTLKGKLPKVKRADEFKAKAITKAKAAGSKIKTFSKKNQTALIAGGGAAGTVVGYQTGKSKERKKAKNYMISTGLGQAAAELGIKGPARLTTPNQRARITKRYASNVRKKQKQMRDFYLG
jgi:hypothetical protein